MKYSIGFQYFLFLVLGGLTFLSSNNQLQAQCHVLADFRSSNVTPNECGIVGIPSNDLLQFHVGEIIDNQYACNSEAPSCSHFATGDGWTLENSMVTVDFANLKNVERIQLVFLDIIGEDDVEMRIYGGTTLLGTFPPTSNVSISVQDAALLQQATHLEIMVCGARLSVLSFGYNCLDISQGSDNYCNLFDDLENLSIPDFNQGDLLFTVDGIPVYGEPNFDIGGGAAWMSGVVVSNVDWSGIEYLTGTNIFVNNSLRFDFSVLEEPVNKVQIAMSEPNGHPMNIRVNGEEWLIEENILDVSYVAPFVSVSVTGENPQIVTLTGFIEELLIGGVETNLSLFCYETGENLFLENDYCLSFEGLIAAEYGMSTGFGAGDFLFAEDGVQMFLQEHAETGIAQRIEVDSQEPPSTLGLSTGQHFILELGKRRIRF